jgi:hypothetical protein
MDLLKRKLKSSEMQNYRLREAMVGVSRDADGHMQIMTLPVGAELAIATVTLESGLVETRWANQTIAIFVQDLKARADLIRTTTA